MNFDNIINDLKYSKDCHNEILALFSHKDLSMVGANRIRLLCNIDIIIDTMKDLKKKI